MPRPVAVTAAAIALATIGLILDPANGGANVAQAAPLYVYVVDLDIVPAEFDTFMAALKENAAASTHDPGCREFNIAVSQKDPHHVLLFEVYDDVAALRAHEATGHYKKYSATTANMVLQRDTRVFSAVSMNKEGK